jgi:hypothetical protein
MKSGTPRTLHKFTKSAALTRTTSTSSSISSINSSPINKSKILHQSLSTKQALLTNQLVSYSQTLFKRIPKLAKHWSELEIRHENILKQKKIALNKLFKCKKNFVVDQKSKQTPETLQKKTAKENEIVLLKNKGFCMESYKNKLKCRLSSINIAKNKLIMDIKDINCCRDKLKLSYDQEILRIEEIYIEKEDVIRLIKEACDRIQCNKSHFYKINENNIKNQKLEQEVLELKEKHQRILIKNTENREKINNQKDTVTSKLILIQLEGNYIEDQMKKSREINKILTYLINRISWKYSTIKKWPK